MLYNWQHPIWPNFVYNSESLQPMLYQYALQASRLSTGLSFNTQGDQLEAQLDLMVQEAINTSRIEGELLNQQDVRSSLRNYLGLSIPPIRVSDSRAEGIAALVLQTRKDLKAPISSDILLHWHQLLLSNQSESILHKPINIGQWRQSSDPMQIVSGAIGYETVHFQAPPSDHIASEIQLLINWINNHPKMPGPLKAGIAHLWFESIHPFDDGNGRIGRALAEYCLGQDNQSNILLSLSSTIEKKRNEYYQQLQQASLIQDKHELNISTWLNWFCQVVLLAQSETTDAIEFVMSKTRFWQKHDSTELSARQKNVLQKIFNAGHDGFRDGINAQKYTALGKCSKATATRDLSDLVNKECLTPIQSKGRHARYKIKMLTL
jgi:Fic family protein